MQVRSKALSRALAIVTTAILSVAILAPVAQLVPAALADDGGGDGGGGGGEGGGDGGGPSDKWRPFDKRSARQASQRRCNCKYLFFCSCSRGAKRQEVTSKPSRPATRPEIIVAGLDEVAVASLRQRGFSVLGQRQSMLLGTSIFRLAVPGRQSVAHGLRTLRSLAGGVLAARNDIYLRLLLAYRPVGRSCRPHLRDFHNHGMDGRGWVVQQQYAHWDC